MLHPATELRFIDERIGYGVFTTRPIPRGTITWARDALDRSFTREAIDAMEPPYRAILDKYTFVDASGLYVLCWDIARFVNHSCDPTCLAPGYDFEIAVRDVAAGEQLTDDYGSLNLELVGGRSGRSSRLPSRSGISSLKRRRSKPSCAVARLTECMLLSLQREQFRSLLELAPELRAKFRNIEEKAYE